MMQPLCVALFLLRLMGWLVDVHVKLHLVMCNMKKLVHQQNVQKNKKLLLT